MCTRTAQSLSAIVLRVVFFAAFLPVVLSCGNRKNAADKKSSPNPESSIISVAPLRSGKPNPSVETPVTAPSAIRNSSKKVWAEENKVTLIPPRSKDGHINDHTLIFDPSTGWHMFGIVAKNPDNVAKDGAKNESIPFEQDFRGSQRWQEHSASFGHAQSANLMQGWRWAEKPFVEQLPAGGVMWAPHIVKNANEYHMVYCTGGPAESFAISYRKSKDLKTWSEPTVLFRDGYQARDPMLFFYEKDHKWVLYYTATENPSTASHHVVAFRTSTDLKTWTTRSIAYTDQHIGTNYGPTESPFVVARNGSFYLFVGPTPYDPPSKGHPNWAHPGYVGTNVFKSHSPFEFNDSQLVGHIAAHAPELIQDGEQHWYISTAGIAQDGLFIMRLHWDDE